MHCTQICLEWMALFKFVFRHQTSQSRHSLQKGFVFFSGVTIILSFVKIYGYEHQILAILEYFPDDNFQILEILELT